MEAQVHTVLNSIPASDKRLSEIKEATANESQLITLRNATRAGWLDNKKMCPPSINEFWNYQDGLSEIEGILFKGERIIVLPKLRDNMTENIHAGTLAWRRA